MRLIFQNTIEEKVASLLSEPLVAMGYELVRVRLIRGPQSSTLQIMFERQDGVYVGISDCTRVNNSIFTILDVEDAVEGQYTLEVSSPGVNKPLTRQKDFTNNIGNLIKLTAAMPIDGRRRFLGRLEAASDDKISIKLEDINQIVEVLNSNILEAALCYEEKKPQKKQNKKRN